MSLRLRYGFRSHSLDYSCVFVRVSALHLYSLLHTMNLTVILYEALMYAHRAILLSFL